MPLWSKSKRSSQPQRSVERTTFDHSTLGSVTLNRTSRAKRISISVLASGEVRLTLPIKGSVAAAKEFLESRIDWILEAQKRVLARQKESNITPLSESEIEVLRIQAKRYLPSRVELLASQYGFRYGRVTIRAARTKWGSCTGDNNLSLSLFLMQLPPHLIDFVILHELCHTVHHNHSPHFHELLNRCTAGEERRFVKELKTFHCGLKADS